MKKVTNFQDFNKFSCYSFVLGIGSMCILYLSHMCRMHVFGWLGVFIAIILIAGSFLFLYLAKAAGRKASLSPHFEERPTPKILKPISSGYQSSSIVRAVIDTVSGDPLTEDIRNNPEQFEDFLCRKASKAENSRQTSILYGILAFDMFALFWLGLEILKLKI